MDMMSDRDVEMFWSGIKGKAIANEVKQFYSQYEGQSWKNVISIGDSDFERLGTQATTAEYAKQVGMDDAPIVKSLSMREVGNHVFKVRTKTLKMLDDPSIEELTIEVAMLKKWLPPMVELDKSCDVNLDDVGDADTIATIEATLDML